MDTFLGWFSCGFVGSFLIAPPCETWSQARHNPVEGSAAPRPLRTSQYPFGLDGLTQAELDQVYVSSLLLFVALRLFLASIVYAIPATMEHPHAPSKKERASIWFLPWIQRFLSHDSVTLMSLNQAEYGAVSLKPTHFLLCCLPQSRSAFEKFRVAINWQRLESLSGRDGSGKWKTSYAKEYPGLLNASLALAHVTAVAHKRSASGSTDSLFAHQEQFEALDAGSLCFDDQQMQPDYAKKSGIDLEGLD
eukprot:Skav215237  [mRNA]  locus=scaffold341:384057:384803:- [translate_table: standard]